MHTPDSGEPRPVNPAPLIHGALLGIDHGLGVIGVAVCDSLWLGARPLNTIRRTTRAAEFALIGALAARFDVKGIVVGLPLAATADAAPGQTGRGARTVQRWASRLAAAVAIPVYLWDERHSTAEAALCLAERGAPDPDRKDAVAASVILQSFIEAHGGGAPLPSPVRGKARP